MKEILQSAVVPDPRECPPIRWGILGAGYIARKFARDVRVTGARVTAVGSRSLDKARAFAAEHGIAGASGSYAELVARDDVDAVYIATPHSEHRTGALLALAAGKPILVEKAFTRNAAEARDVVAAAREAGLFAMEAMWSRFLPHMVAARSLIAEGAIGDVVQVVADHCQALTHVQRLVDPALAGGAILDLGVYPVSFIHSILGVPELIHTHGTLQESGCDATSTTTLAYGDAVAVATTSMRAKSPTRAWVAGTEGYIDFDRVFYNARGFEVVRSDGDTLRYTPPIESDGFEFEIAEASRCIAAGIGESPILTHAATVEVMEIMDEVRGQLGARLPGE